MNLLVVSDDREFAESISQKLIFMRNDDAVFLSKYSEALYDVKLKNAQVVLVHQNESKDLTLELIEKLRENAVCIILLASESDSEFILSAYDCGIDDFVQASADDYELVIKTVNNIKHNSVKLSAQRNIKILKQLNVIDEITGLYNYKFAKQVFENLLHNNSVFLAVSPSNSFKDQFSSEKMSLAVKSSIRVKDAASLGRGAVFYILLTDTDINGAIVVLNKLKENYNIEFCSGIVAVMTDNFDELEQSALQALANASATNAEYVVSQKEEKTLDEWLETPQEKNYKLFRQIFNKKLENVITPAFYSLQKAWEEKLFGTEIEQYTSLEQCVFRLKNKKQDSTLRILYPGFAKILISITHEGLDSPENAEIQLALTKITQKELVNIVEEFIKNFKSSL